MKTILVPTEDNSAMQSALDTALLVARRCDSYIEGFALRWSTAGFAAFDPTGGIPLETDKLAAARVEKQARQIFESFMDSHSVPRFAAKTAALSFGWLDDAPQGEDFVGSYGRVFDVIVMSRPGANETFVHRRALDTGLFESGRPILLAPPWPPSQIATNVLIAWNRSTEQARTTALAMPLLQEANRVTVLTVIGGTEVPGPSAEQLIYYRQRSGIAAEPMRVTPRYPSCFQLDPICGHPLQRDCRPYRWRHSINAPRYALALGRAETAECQRRRWVKCSGAVSFAQPQKSTVTIPVMSAIVNW